MPSNPGGNRQSDRPAAMQWLRVAAALEQQVHCWSLVAMAEYQRASSSSCVKLGQAEPNATDHHMMGVYCLHVRRCTRRRTTMRGGPCLHHSSCGRQAGRQAGREAGRHSLPSLLALSCEAEDTKYSHALVLDWHCTLSSRAARALPNQLSLSLALSLRISLVLPT